MKIFTAVLALVSASLVSARGYLNPEAVKASAGSGYVVVRCFSDVLFEICPDPLERQICSFSKTNTIGVTMSPTTIIAFPVISWTIRTIGIVLQQELEKNKL